MITSAPKGALVRLQRDLDHFKSAEQQVARLCLDRAAEVVGMSVQQVAAAAGTSTATVVRMCQTLGFTGFAQFKLVLAAETAPTSAGVRDDVTPDDLPADIARKVFEAEAGTLSDTLAVLDLAAFTTATEAIAATDHVRFFGVGTSAPVAIDAAFQFQQYGTDASSLVDAIQMEISTLGLHGACVAVGISHSGSTRATIDALERAKEQGAHTIALTSYQHSPIAAVAATTLVVAAHETHYRSGASAGRLAHLAVIDALNVAVANRDPVARSEVHNHAAAIVARHSV